MKVTLKINGTKELTITPETPLEHEYMALIKEAEKYEVSKEANSNTFVFKLKKAENDNTSSNTSNIRNA